MMTPDQLPRKISGFRSRVINEIIDVIAMLTRGDMMPSAVRRGGKPATEYIPPHEAFEPRLAGKDKLELADYGARERCCWFRLVKKTIVDGAGVAWSTDHWTVTFTGATGTRHVYLVFDRAAVTVTLASGATLPDGDDDTAIRPVWEVQWDGTNITGVTRPRVFAVDGMV